MPEDKNTNISVEATKIILSDEEIRLKAEAKRKKKEKQRLRRQKEAQKRKARKQPLPYAERMIAAKKWLAEYDVAIQGKNIIKKYRKHFHLEPMCALQEIQMLKYPLTDEQIKKFHEVERNKVIQERNKKRKRRELLEAKREARKNKGETFDKFPDSNDRFYMVMGYTSGGAPYGLTWEELGVEPYSDPFTDEDDEDGENEE